MTNVEIARALEYIGARLGSGLAQALMNELVCRLRGEPRAESRMFSRHHRRRGSACRVNAHGPAHRPQDLQRLSSGERRCLCRRHGLPCGCFTRSSEGLDGAGRSVSSSPWLRVA